jgi:hypothetical protein
MICGCCNGRVDNPLRVVDRGVGEIGIDRLQFVEATQLKGKGQQANASAKPSNPMQSKPPFDVVKAEALAFPDLHLPLFSSSRMGFFEK